MGEVERGVVCIGKGSGRVGRWGFLMMEVVASIVCCTSHFPFDKNQKPSFSIILENGFSEKNFPPGICSLFMNFSQVVPAYLCKTNYGFPGSKASKMTPREHHR